MKKQLKCFAASAAFSALTAHPGANAADLQEAAAKRTQRSAEEIVERDNTTVGKGKYDLALEFGYSYRPSTEILANTGAPVEAQKRVLSTAFHAAYGLNAWADFELSVPFASTSTTYLPSAETKDQTARSREVEAGLRVAVADGSGFLPATSAGISFANRSGSNSLAGTTFKLTTSRTVGPVTASLDISSSSPYNRAAAGVSSVTSVEGRITFIANQSFGMTGGVTTNFTRAYNQGPAPSSTFKTTETHAMSLGAIIVVGRTAFRPSVTFGIGESSSGPVLFSLGMPLSF